ncbi:MAG: VWA domain-containing protein [Acidobacteriota bacterium]|nr:VWA domain-containing protein [Blastocatellia bacterium]MDW8240220.1 VWA domain-containing protein [Acidobacteriota bacterium]
MRQQLFSLHLVCLLLVVILTHGWAPAQSSSQNPPTPSKPPAQAQPAAAQEQDDEPPIDLTSRLVNVFFSVQDKRNALITDLRQEDVQILENGQLQEIFIFTRQTDLPLTIALLLDISGSMQYVLPQEKAAAARFLSTMVRPMKDSVAILQFRDETILVQDFTSSMERLERALESVRYTPRTTTDNTSKFGGTSLYDAIYVTCQDLLGRQPGRRTIILMTDGEDTTSRYKIGDAIDRALRAEATIYAVGIGDRFRFGVNEGVLKKLSQETGGRAYFPENPEQLDAAFRQIEEELRSQYLIAYYPSNTAMDGSFRKIEVRAPNRKDLRFRHRLGYYALKGTQR